MLTRLFRWTCDACGKVEEREAYGFPSRGWRWHRVKSAALDSGKIVHSCGDECAVKLGFVPPVKGESNA